MLAAMKLRAFGLLLVVGCGDGGSSGPIARANYARESAATFCAKAYSCCNMAELTELELRDGFTGEAECVEVVAAQFADSVALTSPSVDFDADAAGDCRDEAEGASCSQFFSGAEVTPACDRVYSGTLADGATCEIDQECASAYCAFDFEASENVCATLPGAGAACEFRCEDGLACIDGMCSDLLANGAECMSDLDCESGYCATTCADRPTSTTCDGA
jgi:hypothetical protein